MFAALAAAVVVVHSGLYGQVRIDPGMPVCRVGAPCWKPAPGAVLAFTRNAHTARATADANGRYRIALRTGAYVVRVLRPRGIAAPKSFRAVVPRGRYKLLNLSVDVGIR